MHSVEVLKARCYQLGQDTPNKLEHEEIMKKLAKIIVQEKIHDDDAFEIASKAFAEGFQGLKLGETSDV